MMGPAVRDVNFITIIRNEGKAYSSLHCPHALAAFLPHHATKVPKSAAIDPRFSMSEEGQLGSRINQETCHGDKSAWDRKAAIPLIASLDA